MWPAGRGVDLLSVAGLPLGGSGVRECETTRLREPDCAGAGSKFGLFYHVEGLYIVFYLGHEESLIPCG
jgi:hypothetical protein